MYFANREVCALTKALHRCLARLVTSASELQDDSRTRGLPDRLLGGVVEFVVLETVARGGTGALHLCTQLSEKRACIASTWRTNEACHWLAVCCVEGSGQVWARLGHDRSQAERFRRRAVQKASSSESEPFRKRAVKEVQKASSSESEQFRKRAVQKAKQFIVRKVSKLQIASKPHSKQVKSAMCSMLSYLCSMLSSRCYFTVNLTIKHAVISCYFTLLSYHVTSPASTLLSAGADGVNGSQCVLGQQAAHLTLSSVVLILRASAMLSAPFAPMTLL